MVTLITPTAGVLEKIVPLIKVKGLSRFFKYICIGLFLFSSAMQAEEIVPAWRITLQSMPPEEKLYLEVFLRSMLVNSEGGYVLTGAKPVCMEGILSSGYSIRHIGTRLHKRSVILKEGYRVWKKYFNSYKSEKLIICCKDHPDSMYSDWIHLLWIHPVKLKEVVQHHLTLFQYVLGPQVTPESFLCFLSNPSEDMPHDYVLLGIFLGFGAQNSLYYRRLELIRRQLFSREAPPYNDKTKGIEFPLFGYMGFDKDRSFRTEPSFGYLSLGEEYRSLQESSRSDDYSSSSRFKIPLFAIYKKDEETLDILAEYKRNQKMIEGYLEGPNFLEDMLKLIFE